MAAKNNEDNFSDDLEQLSLFSETYQMAKALQSLGMIETKGFIALIEASDAMLKAADVQFLGWDKVGSALVAAFVTGDVAAVKAATDAGAAARAPGEFISGAEHLPAPLRASVPPDLPHHRQRAY